MALDISGGFGVPQPFPVAPSNPTSARGMFPIVSDEEDPPRFQPEVVPASGARWGKPGAFSWSATNLTDEVSGIQPIGVNVTDDQPPLEKTKFFEINVSAERDNHHFDTTKCKEGESLNHSYFTTYWILNNINFEYSEEKPKPNIWSSNPIYRWRYDLSFLPRVARASELQVGCNPDHRDPASLTANPAKWVPEFENDTMCAIRLKCDDSDPPKPTDDQTGDPLECKPNPQTGDVPTPDIQPCGCHFLPPDGLPPLPPVVHDSDPCAFTISTGNDFIDRINYWSCKCCP